MKMTKQQAIEALKRLLLNIAGEKDCEAIELAIAALQSDPDAPDWSQAPEWARWYAIDGDGQRWWFEIEPTLKETTYRGKGKIEIDNLPERMKLFKRPDQ